MALSQTITNEQGAKVTYHRVSALALDYDKGEATVTIKSYATQNLRKAEKDARAVLKDRDEMVAELNTLVFSPTPENEVRRIELTEAVNAASAQSAEPRHLLQSTHSIPLASEALSLNDVYNWLKTSIYTDAHDAQLGE